MTETITVPRGTAVGLAWLAGLVMVATAMSVVGLFLAPVAVPLALWAATRRATSWAARVPLLLGAFALLALVIAFLLDGSPGGTTVPMRSS